VCVSVWFLHVAHLEYYSAISVSMEILKLFSLKELSYHYSVTSISFRETQCTQMLICDFRNPYRLWFKEVEDYWGTSSANYTTKTNEMNNFLNQYLIYNISYMFRTSWVHPQEECFMCSMVCLTCIGVSSLVGIITILLEIKKEHILLPIRLPKIPSEKYTRLHAPDPLPKHPRGSKHEGDIRN
jgi:hypothetical protein